MDLLIQLASPLLTAAMAVGGAYIAFNDRLTKLETKNEEAPQASETSDLSEVRAEIAELKTDIAVIKSEMKSLADETRKHNNVMERTFKLEVRVDSLENRM